MWDKLPLADIIAVNLDHYRLDADYKHGLLSRVFSQLNPDS
jgi:hypothetical protein